MIKTIKSLIQAVNFMQLPKGKRKIVFYSEGGNYWPIFSDIITNLLEKYDNTVCYVTSDKNDPGCQYFHDNYTSFVIDEGYVRDWLFLNINSDIVLMTMPDLGQYRVKRSKHKVHYIYIQHALMSLHMVYRFGAFDHYDTIFCAGEHHDKEVRKTEKIYNLKKKNIAKIGYARIDKLIKLNKGASSKIEHILIAPSWGKDSLLEGHNNVEGLIERLLSFGYFVTLRPHPETIKSTPKVVDKIAENFSSLKMFNYERNIRNMDSFFNSDVMITDWSGSALEYGLGLGKPVIFLNFPKKVNNSRYSDIDITPFEVIIRKEIGVVSSIDIVDKDLINSLSFNKLNPKDYVFNVGDSCSHAVEYIDELLARIDQQ
jgi:hypothetical protein